MRRTAALLVCLALAAGCSDDGGPDETDVPSVDAFADGTCSTVAEDVRTIGRLLPTIGDGPKVDQDVLDALTEAQDGLRAVGEGAEPGLQEPLRKLSQAVGFIRIRGVGSTYEPFLAEDAQQAYEKLLDVCTGDAAAG